MFTKIKVKTIADRHSGWTIKKGPFGWFGIPEEDNPNMERWGFTPNMGTREEVMMWIDEHKGLNRRTQQ